MTPEQMAKANEERERKGKPPLTGRVFDATDTQRSVTPPQQPPPTITSGYLHVPGSDGETSSSWRIYLPESRTPWWGWMMYAGACLLWRLRATAAIWLGLTVPGMPLRPGAPITLHTPSLRKPSPEE